MSSIKLLSFSKKYFIKVVFCYSEHSGNHLRIAKVFSANVNELKIMFDLCITGWLTSYLTLMVLIYCAIQNCVEVNRWLNKQDRLKLIEHGYDSLHRS